MPRKSNKRNKGKRVKTRRQKQIVMIGCSKNRKSKKVSSSLIENPSCPNCGPNCHCGPNCNCPHPCPGSCYLNRHSHNKKHKGGSGCGSCSCPLAPLSWNQMNKFGGSYPEILNKQVLDNNGILGTGQNGGTCACGQVKPMYGGSHFFKPIGPMPGPFVGSPWNINNLPSDGNANYLKNYSDVIVNDPQQQMTMNNAGYKTLNSMVGGYTYKNSKKDNKTSISSKGGGLVPQDLVNLGNNFTFNLKSAYNALNGYKAPVDPLPYKGQLASSINNKILL